MKREKDIRDDEIRIIGGDKGKEGKHPGLKWLLLLLAVAIIGMVLWLIRLTNTELTVFPEPPSDKDDETTVFEPSPVIRDASEPLLPLSQAEETGHGFVEMFDRFDSLNGIQMRFYIPHQMSLSLSVGAINRKDPSILFAAQAADVRADNGGIVGAFVLEGEPLARGGSKKGYCAIINDTVSIGVAENTSLFEEATEKGGYFFRQFPLVGNGQLVENELRGKSIRRAICDRNGEIFIVETLSEESLHDFAQALVDLNVDQAIYLVGSNSYGWATDAQGQRHEFGNPTPPKKKWKNISYLVMKEKI